jgi:hypothetical protein
MKRFLTFFLLVAIGCGGSDSIAPHGLALGVYAAYRPNAGTVWTASWPAGTSRTDCAQIGSTITITGANTFTEDRVYATPPGVGTFFTTQQTFTGTYAHVGSGNTYSFTVDGATDTGTSQSSSTSSTRDALVITRTFPLRGGCQVGGPYTIEYIK